MSVPIYVMLEKVRSAYNVGSVFRSCDSAGVDKLFLTGYTATPPHHKVAKTALGSAQTVTWQHYDQALELAATLKSEGVLLLALEPVTQASNLFTTNISSLVKQQSSSAVCLLFGNEVDGLSSELLEIADQIVAIPHFGHKESLNIAVAAGIAIYETWRQLRLSYTTSEVVSPGSTSEVEAKGTQ